MPGRVRREHRKLRRLHQHAGPRAHAAELRRDHRRAGGEDPHPRARRRRRLRHPLAGVSRVLRADARRAQGGQAGEVGRLALRDHRQRPPRPRRASRGRARARPRRPLPRAARALGGERRRLPFAARAAHQHAQPGHARDQRLPHPGALRPPPARAHQHHLDHCLPRRGPPERLLPRRAPGGRGGARARHRPPRAAPHQLHPEGGVPVQDAVRLDLRQRRPGGRIRGSPREVGLGQLRVQKKGLDAQRKTARHRLRGVLRALGRRRAAEGRSGDPLRQHGKCDAACDGRAVGTGARNRPAGSRGPDPWIGPRNHSTQGKRSRRSCARSAPARWVRAR